jgi:hypothetical protein
MDRDTNIELLKMFRGNTYPTVTMKLTPSRNPAEFTKISLGSIVFVKHTDGVQYAIPVADNNSVSDEKAIWVYLDHFRKLCVKVKENYIVQPDINITVNNYFNKEY